MSELGVGAGALPKAPERTSSLRLIATLGGAGALAGLLVVVVFDLTRGPIEAHKIEVLQQAIGEVLDAPARYEVFRLTAAGFSATPPTASEGAGAQGLAEKLYVGFDRDGRATGVAIEAAAAGFQDVITLLYGFDPASGRLLGMKVLDSRETPGLGDRIEKDSAFVARFAGAEPPLVAVKRRSGAPGEIDAISGATISSRAVVRIINESLVDLRPRIEAHWREVSR